MSFRPFKPIKYGTQSVDYREYSGSPDYPDPKPPKPKPSPGKKDKDHYRVPIRPYSPKPDLEDVDYATWRRAMMIKAHNVLDDKGLDEANKFVKDNDLNFEIDENNANSYGMLAKDLKSNEVEMFMRGTNINILKRGAKQIKELLNRDTPAKEMLSEFPTSNPVIESNVPAFRGGGRHGGGPGGMLFDPNEEYGNFDLDPNPNSQRVPYRPRDLNQPMRDTGDEYGTAGREVRRFTGDLATDIDLYVSSGKHTKSYQESEKMIREYQEAGGKISMLNGYSKGGGKSLILGEQENIPSTTFNPAAGKGFYDLARDGLTQTHKVFKTTDDAVSSGLDIMDNMGRLKPNMEIQRLRALDRSMIPVKDGLNSHSLDQFTERGKPRGEPEAHGLAKELYTRARRIGDHIAMRDVDNYKPTELEGSRSRYKPDILDYDDAKTDGVRFAGDRASQAVQDDVLASLTRRVRETEGEIQPVTEPDEPGSFTDFWNKLNDGSATRAFGAEGSGVSKESPHARAWKKQGKQFTPEEQEHLNENWKRQGSPKLPDDMSEYNKDFDLKKESKKLVKNHEDFEEASGFKEAVSKNTFKEGLAEGLSPSSMGKGIIGGIVGNALMKKLDPEGRGGLVGDTLGSGAIAGAFVGGAGEIIPGAVGALAGVETARGVTRAFEKAGASKDFSEASGDVTGGAVGALGAVGTGALLAGEGLALETGGLSLAVGGIIGAGAYLWNRFDVGSAFNTAGKTIGDWFKKYF